MSYTPSPISITVVGVPEDGCLGLTSRASNAVSSARVVAGHPRHLEWFPQFDGLFLDMTQGFATWFNQVIDESEEGDVVVLASGDPLFFGIGTRLLTILDAKELRFIPSQSCAQLAFSRLGLPWHDARFLSCHGRSLDGLTSKLQQGDLFAILTDGKNTPQVIAQHLTHYHETHWTLAVCEQLGGLDERVRRFDVAALACCETEFAPLNVIVAIRGDSQRWGGNGQFAADSSFAKRMPQNGLITKMAVRHLALTSLKISPDDTVWDIGAGSASVAIESGKLCWNGRVFAIESNEQCFESIEENIRCHGTDHVKLVRGKAPVALVDLPQPDAVFVGGSRGEMVAILDMAWQQLKPRGRLVITAVTIDTVTEVYQWAKQHALNINTLLANISQTQPLAHYQRYQAENPIHIFSLEKTPQQDCVGVVNEQ
ncbi:bifunctional cobalt-precorrin-7 (C(5))-methyltransferase/cobalt-precorrin-6B (C(15))-methyltransferase [Vibrio panuliri]|uniref:Precorrin-6Y-methylase n=1 Tax=Vibrio panuliri TaxID=1381081 RepID=A0ABX3F848_9VIBR|nr:bifunctional cobalt-precorrin-7 (C(5))-methyltransferase/cobalt-precorrin-6B (C(15))-methyltransferase [Vibrio panuliri]KAB1454018.1 bifunctional cobalt-precorrin-7 (C(5))-methyltransferase/cobalt-precorrin-6B (C(15))-methyltransferase [Vibrio panuliri]OLQ84476.1 precorrin-6Y-methylase [Vibrio panuliri]